MSDKPHVTIYTDGGCSPNPGPGGWGAILRFTDSGGELHERELMGGTPDTTNNRMELTAAIEALRALKMPCRVEMHTDSLYLKNGITRWLKGWIKKGWKLSSGKPVKNKDLWQALDTEAARHDINWHWVKAHADNALNNRADALAQASRPA